MPASDAGPARDPDRKGRPAHAAGTSAQAADTPVLEMRGLRKVFGATVAADDVDLTVHAGEVLALLGQNGAGKSTLIKMLAGVYRPDAGEFRVDGEPYDPQAAARSGTISFIHQDLGLIDWMTVAENMALSQGYRRRGGFIDWRATRERAAEALRLVAGDIDAGDRIQDLSRAERSLVAIARALSTRARIIVLDEPTASLPQGEVDILLDVLRRLRARGHAFLYVSHRLDEVFALADRIAVMRDGRLVRQCRTAATDPAQIIEAIVGKPAEALPVRAPRPAAAATLLELTGVRVGPAGPIDLAVARGEVVGLVGLRGAGQALVGRALIGALPVSAGRITLDGRAADLSSPAAAVATGIGFVPSDRIGESIASTLSVRENLFLNPGATGRGPFGWRGRADEQAEARRLGSGVHLRPNEPGLPIETLSGGNQQKVVLARWLRIGCALLVLEEPTAGVDVGARMEIYRLLDGVLAAGKAILVISTDLEEVERICHRALVFRDGRIVAALEGDGLTQQALLQATTLDEAGPAREPLAAAAAA